LVSVIRLLSQKALDLELLGRQGEGSECVWVSPLAKNMLAPPARKTVIDQQRRCVLASR